MSSAFKCDGCGKLMESKTEAVVSILMPDNLTRLFARVVFAANEHDDIFDPAIRQPDLCRECLVKVIHNVCVSDV